MVLRAFVFVFIFATCHQGYCQSEKILATENAWLSFVDNVKIASRDPGIVRSIKVKLGDKVTENQTLIELDSELYQSGFETAKAELAIAQKESQNEVDILFAEKTTEVNQKILERSRIAIAQYAKSISESELDQLKLELDRSRLSKKQAQHTKKVNELSEKLAEQKLADAKFRLNYRTIQSPIEGVVAEIMPQVAEAVNANQTVIRVVNLKKLRVKAEVKYDLIDQVRVGNKCEFQLVDTKGSVIPGKKVVTKLTYVSQEVDPESKGFKVHAEIDNSDGKFHAGTQGFLKVFAR